MLIIDPQGGIRCLYGEAVNLASLGALSISRLSYVEPDDQGQWWADMAPVKGPSLGPFALRSAALAAEEAWSELFLTHEKK